MSTVKIKTEPATTAEAAAAVEVQVKLEQSLSTADIKLEQHSSDIDTKFEPDSDTDSEDDDIKSEDDDDDSENDQDQITETHNTQRKLKCDYPGCSRSFNHSGNLKTHRHEHKLQTKINTTGNTFTLTRQSLDDRWQCPIPDCTSTAKTFHSLSGHIGRNHRDTMKQHQQQLLTHMTRSKRYFVDVDSFYVNGARCGYHNTIGVFICYECKLVPEFLLTHLQQNHGYDEKSIDTSTLPESAVTAGADTNGDQHTSNTHLAAAISQPYRQQHRDIVQGWVCVTSDCGHCGYTFNSKNAHKRSFHKREELLSVPALVLRLFYAKTQTLCFLITRLDQASGAVSTSRNRVSQHKLDYSHNGLNTQDGDEDDASQDVSTYDSRKKRQWKCEYLDCERIFNSSSQLSIHRREHKLEVVITVYGTHYTLTRQSADDRWACPIPDCDSMCKTIHGTHKHFINAHHALVKHKRASMEDDDNNQQQIKKRPRIFRYLKIDDFYISGTKCGYHTTTGLFICHECRLVPECLLTHLQQRHGYDEKSIDNAILPESARSMGSDPNRNQHTSNSHLASTISQPFQQQHQDIIQGWLCITSNCGNCGYAIHHKKYHKIAIHNGEQITTVPALVLRLLYATTQTSCFLITRLDTITNNIEQSHSAIKYKSESDSDDGDELVLSDYSEEDDVH